MAAKYLSVLGRRNLACSFVYSGDETEFTKTYFLQEKASAFLFCLLGVDWIEEQSMSTSSPFSRGRGRGRHRDDGSPNSSPFERKSPAVGGLLDDSSKSMDHVQMEMRTGRGRARPDRSKAKRPDVQMYVPPSRRQQQQQEINQNGITPDLQKSSKPSQGKTKSGVQKNVHPHQKIVQEKSESVANLEDSINSPFVENMRLNETYQAGNMKGVQPVSASLDEDGHVQKKSVFISQSDEGPLLNPQKIIKKQKTSHQQECSCIEITKGGDAEHESFTSTKEEKSKHSVDLDACLEENKNVKMVCLSDTHPPNRNQIMKVSQDRTNCDTEDHGSIDSVLFLEENMSNETIMETCVCVNTATSENASVKFFCEGNGQIPCTSLRSILQFSNKSQLNDQQKVTNADITVNDQFSHLAKLGISSISDANKLVLDGETIYTTMSDENKLVLNGETIDATISDADMKVLDGEMINTTVSDVNKVVLDGETRDITMSDTNKVVLDGEMIDTTVSDANKEVLDGETRDITMSDTNKVVLDGEVIDTTVSDANKKVVDGEITDTTMYDANKVVLDGEMIDTTVSDANKVVLDCETIDTREYSFHSYSKNSQVKDFSSTTDSEVEKYKFRGKESDKSKINQLNQINGLQDLKEPVRVDSKITNVQDSQAYSSGQLNEKEGTDHILTSNQGPEQHSKCEPVINKEILLQHTFSDRIKQSSEDNTREQTLPELENLPADDEKQIDGDRQVEGETTEIKNESYTSENRKTQTDLHTGERTDLRLEVQKKNIAVDGNVERSDVQSEPISEDDVDEDSWDAMFGEDGECLNPTAMDELTKAVGKVKIKKTKINYLEYSPREPQMNFDSYSHIIEIFDFPKEFITRDLIAAFQSFVSKGFDIKWVDDTHALGVFSSPIAAQSALSMIHPLLKVCPLSEASQQSKLKAKRCTEFLQPYKPRPESSAAVARRLVTGALGLGPPRISKEKRELERKQLQEARAKRRHEKKEKEDMWEGTYGKCAMDA
ncbi:hypothetical protein ACJMK2_005141 [Sinanodonta woodiana]|uniref:TRAM domain-containing protein n=1 Tax=Sinanodonta woodiana TaxID=1069815 RepID=A0ABD3VP59_SINWO